MSVFIGVLTVKFQLPGCTSLKEKRSRLSKAREGFRHHNRVAACESACQNDHRQAVWTYVTVTPSRSDTASILSSIENDLAKKVDAVVIDTIKEYL